MKLTTANFNYDHVRDDGKDLRFKDGDGSAASAENPPALWDDYELVCHLDGDGKDSTGN